MERPGPALIGSLLVHAGVVAAVLGIGLFAPKAAPRPIMNAVPVSIVSSTIVEAAAADNPSEELVTEDAATAPVAPPPEPVPAPPEPRPVPPPLPTPVPAKKAPTPPRPTPPRPTPPRAQPTPPRPTPPRREESLDLDALAGPARPSPRTGPRPPTGQQGQGTAPRAIGPAQVAAIFRQAEDNWVVICDVPGARELRIQMDVTLDERGRVTSGPTLVGARSDPVYRAAADSAVRAIRQTAPFDVPQGFEGGRYRPTFITERACNR